MLNRRRSAGLSAVAVAAALFTSIAVAPTALAEGEAECLNGVCVVKGGEEGGPGGGELTRPVVGPGVGEEGAADPDFCQYGGVPAPLNCEQNFDPTMNCMWTFMSPQPAVPAGKDPSIGGWEECIPTGGKVLGMTYPRRWWEGPAGQAGTATPEQAARQVVAQMRLEGIEMGMVPRSLEEDSRAMGAVGMPTWMWVANPEDPLAWGPYTVTEEVEGLSVTATARPRNVTWDMGNGDWVVCTTAGTEYQKAYGKQPSPDCGYEYQRTGAYTVTALTTWDVEWSAGDGSGTLQTVTRSAQPVRIGDLQAVNVTPQG